MSIRRYMTLLYNHHSRHSTLLNITDMDTGLLIALAAPGNKPRHIRNHVHSK